MQYLLVPPPADLDPQLERVFGATFGLRPKQFQRMVRLERTLRHAIAQGRTDAALALEHGYFDQSHLGRDLRELVGLPLRTLVQGVQAGDTRHWPLLVGARYGEHRITTTGR